MVETRKATGHSAPRKADPLMEAGPASTKRVPKPTSSTAKRGRPAGSKVTKAATDAKNKTKAAAGKVKKEAVKAEKKVEKKAPETKANTGKPRAKKAEGKKEKVVGGRVEKKPAAKKAKTQNKREPGIVDKIEGAVEKVVGTAQGKPGKKVCPWTALQGVICLDRFWSAKWGLRLWFHDADRCVERLPAHERCVGRTERAPSEEGKPRRRPSATSLSIVSKRPWARRWGRRPRGQGLFVQGSPTGFHASTEQRTCFYHVLDGFCILIRGLLRREQVQLMFGGQMVVGSGLQRSIPPLSPVDRQFTMLFL